MKYTELADLIGRVLEDKTYKKVFSTIDEQPIDEIAYESRYFRIYKRSGICLGFHSPENQVETIDLYAEGYEGYHQYNGTLPFDLNFGASSISALDIKQQPISRVVLPKNPNAEILKEHPFEKREIISYLLADELLCRLTFNKSDKLSLVSMHPPLESKQN